MTQTGFHFSIKTHIFKVFILCVFCISSASSFSQATADFSGTWIRDVSKSDDFYKNFDVKCIIMQTADAIKINTIYSLKGESVTRESAFTLDGKETVSEEGAKKSAVWSKDKKTLTTSDTKDYGGDLVGVTAVYSLSADGRLLTIKTADINPAVAPVTQVFNKK